MVLIYSNKYNFGVDVNCSFSKMLLQNHRKQMQRIKQYAPYISYVEQKEILVNKWQSAAYTEKLKYEASKKNIANMNRFIRLHSHFVAFV